MANKPEPLRTILDNIQSYPWDATLYLKGQHRWTPETFGVVLSPDRNPAEEDEFQHALSLQQVQDVIENAKNQKPDVDTEQLVEALNYYFRNDAFINLSKSD